MEKVLGCENGALMNGLVPLEEAPERGLAPPTSEDKSQPSPKNKFATALILTFQPPEL